MKNYCIRDWFLLILDHLEKNMDEFAKAFGVWLGQVPVTLSKSTWDHQYN